MNAAAEHDPPAAPSTATPSTAWTRARDYLRVNRHTLGVTLLRGLPVIVGVAALMWGLEWLGLLRGFENYGLDAMLRLNDGNQSRDVVLVTIDNEEYARHFGGRSPLDAEKLCRAIQLIGDGQPRVIGVDLDTSHEDFARLDCQLPPQAVFARSATVVDPAADHVTLRPGAFLGGKYGNGHSEHAAAEPHSGLAVLPFDADGVIRRFWVQVPCEIAEHADEHARDAKHDDQDHAPSSGHGDHDVAWLDSFPFAIVRRYCEESKNRKLPGCPGCAKLDAIVAEAQHAHQLPIINFAAAGDRFATISYTQLLKETEFPAWKENARVKDKIVILGGAYDAARDEYATPVGLRQGVTLVAEVVEAICQDTAISPASHTTAFFLDILFGLTLVGLNWYFRFRFAVFMNVLLIIMLSLLGSLLVYRALAFWFNFMAVLVAAWIHVLVEHIHEKRELEHEVARYRGKYGPLEHA